MPSDDSKLVKLVNASGFLFQLKVEQLISETSEDHGKSILAREHKWVDSSDGNEGFIDLITSAGTNGKIIIECKRVRDADWVFLVPYDAKETKNTRVPWSRRISDAHQGVAWDDFGFKPESLEAEFCVIRGQGEKQTPMLERLSGILVASVESLANEELNYERSIGHAGLRFYFPVIVTTATLQVCRFQAADIDLKSGDLKQAEFETVPFIRFTKSLHSNLASSRPPSNLPDAARENRRTVFVVNVEGLVEFLSGEWEFNPPAWGGPWPWDLPVWSDHS
jgi:hypothetical protein